MRDRIFVAEHRGGLLRAEQHHQLITWACECSEHVLHLFGRVADPRLRNALGVAAEWKKGSARVGDARKASVEAIRVAKECTDAAAIAVARSVGHAVATAHMADHSLRAAWYALKAVKSAGGNTDQETKWQNDRLPVDIKALVLTARKGRNV